MPNFDNVVEWFEGAMGWLLYVANDIVIGLIIALLLIVWIWKGRDNGHQSV